MRPIHLVGLILWRGGLLLAGGWVLYEAARLILRFICLPAQLEIGFGLLVAGLAMVLLSLILERVQDLRTERELRK